jgi:hypothetical protein
LNAVLSSKNHLMTSKKDVESRAALVHKISFSALPNVSIEDKNILAKSCSAPHLLHQSIDACVKNQLKKSLIFTFLKSP